MDLRENEILPISWSSKFNIYQLKILVKHFEIVIDSKNYKKKKKKWDLESYNSLLNTSVASVKQQLEFWMNRQVKFSTD